LWSICFYKKIASIPYRSNLKGFINKCFKYDSSRINKQQDIIKKLYRDDENVY